VLLAGARQAGKTTLSKQLGGNSVYLNYDSAEDRRLMAQKHWDEVDFVNFEELHKMRKWKSWLKGVFDADGVEPGLLVTGSARLEIFRRGGDSLVGRHFLHRLHPFTVRETASEVPAPEALERLMTVGGFPRFCTRPSPSTGQRFASVWRKAVAFRSSWSRSSRST
jgi:hypothetical protein